MFDYCFPLKRLVSLCVLYNAVYVLPFPGLNDVFKNTKEQLRMAFGSMLTSGNYQALDLRVDPEKQALEIANGEGLSGFDIGLMAVQFLFGLLKGAGEAFSPNIAIARKIQVLSEMIGPALVGAVNKAKEVGNRANEIAGGSGDVTGDPITECDLPFSIPEIPIILISLSLVPIDIFFPLPGPPLGPLGMIYLQFFHSAIAPGRLILGSSESEKEADRCALRFPPLGQAPIALLTNNPLDCLTGSFAQQGDQCNWDFDPTTGEPIEPDVTPSALADNQGAGGSPSLKSDDEDADPGLIGGGGFGQVPHDCD